MHRKIFSQLCSRQKRRRIDRLNISNHQVSESFVKYPNQSEYGGGIINSDERMELIVVNDSSDNHPNSNAN